MGTPNPNFKQPGPDQHMLVIIGFDPHKKQFITNDPGTKIGANYHYNYTTLYNAIRDYPAGYNKPIKRRRRTQLLSINKAA